MHVCNVGFLPRCHLWAVLSHGLNTYVCISTCVPAGVHTRGTLQSAQFIAGLKKEKKNKPKIKVGIKQPKEWPSL